ncbi:hypothetical protein J1N51_13675 [Psychrosphaera ytuae]|uniref:Apea-like HEPN domain-containing protein n=1 Tax=Psychrosphaera ytuae TaxID=2820710 RepID=A0A975DDP0_9GAMM|nr:hypothetical protein [Psychrosphaera ytuae]QTH63745.1 hypothetical protein J1N51_13675 [Psychrosphaera ytuae]
MKANWKDKSEQTVKHALAKLEPMFKVTDTGNVQWELDPELYLQFLYSNVACKTPLCFDTQLELFFEAYRECRAKSNTVDADELISSFQLKVESQERKSKNFTLVTTINVNNKCKLDTMSIGELEISFQSTIDNNLKLEREDKLKSIHAACDKPSETTFVVVKAKSCGVKTFLHDALRVINLCRGMIELQLDLIGNRFDWSNKEAVYPSASFTKLGKYHSIHCDNETHLYREDYPEPTKSVSFKNMQLLNQQLKSNLDKVLKSKFSKRLQTIVDSIIAALDTQPPSLRFLHLWISAEIMLNAKEEKTLARRLATLFADREFHSKLFASLKQDRNHHIHRFEKTNSVELKCNVMRKALSYYFNFLINNELELTKYEDIISFLDFTHDPKALEHQKALLEKQIAFLDSKLPTI